MLQGIRPILAERVWRLGGWVCSDRNLLCSKSRNGECRPEVGQAITTSGSHASHPKTSIHNLSDNHQLGSKCSNTQAIFTPKLKLCPADIFCLSSHHPPVTRTSAGTEHGTSGRTVPSRIIVPGEETKGLPVDRCEITFIREASKWKLAFVLIAFHLQIWLHFSPAVNLPSFLPAYY